MKIKQTIPVILLTLCITSISCGADLGTNKGKYSYTIGREVAENIKKQGIELDAASFNQAVKDVMDGKKKPVNKAGNAAGHYVDEKGVNAKEKRFIR